MKLTFSNRTFVPLKNCIIAIFKIIILIACFPLHAETIQNRKIIESKLNRECKNNKELIGSFQKYGTQKQSLIINSYCSCRTNFILKNFNTKQIANILDRKESLSEDLFVKMVIECTQHIDNLTKD
jgi:hypothetical protein